MYTIYMGRIALRSTTINTLLKFFIFFSYTIGDTISIYIVRSMVINATFNNTCIQYIWEDHHYEAQILIHRSNSLFFSS
jgi:hypothetical protein